jgi:hypothetical protein
MDSFVYNPSSDMVTKDAFQSFPTNALSVFAKNLVRDMSVVENRPGIEFSMG